jgi:hypothetical protein
LHSHFISRPCILAINNYTRIEVTDKINDIEDRAMVVKSRAQEIQLRSQRFHDTADRLLGRAVQVEPMQPISKAPRTERLRL